MTSSVFDPSTSGTPQVNPSPASVAAWPLQTTRAMPEPPSRALPLTVASGWSNQASAPGASIESSGGDVSGAAAAEAGRARAGAGAGAGAGGCPVTGGTGLRRHRVRARFSAFSFLLCFLTNARRCFRERCERKNARRREAILRLKALSRLDSAWQGLACAATGSIGTTATAIPPLAANTSSRPIATASGNLTKRCYARASAQRKRAVGYSDIAASIASGAGATRFTEVPPCGSSVRRRRACGRP